MEFDAVVRYQKYKKNPLFVLICIDLLGCMRASSFNFAVVKFGKEKQLFLFLSKEASLLKFLCRPSKLLNSLFNTCSENVIL